MRTLEIRRHSLTKKGENRGSGSQLSREGVQLARNIGESIGPFDQVVASTVPRAAETAIAMGFAVDELIDELCPAGPDFYAEVGHHERWSWDDPFVRFTEFIERDGPTKQLAHMQERVWKRVLDPVPSGGAALIISHGRVIECGLIACFPSAPHAEWGAPFQHGEGARVIEKDGRWIGVQLLRIPA